MGFIERIRGNIYSPEILVPNVQATRVGLEWGLLGRFTPPIFDSGNIHSLRQNLQSYLKYVSDEGVADLLVREYVKAGGELPEGRFILSEPLAQCRGKKSRSGTLTPEYRFLNPKDAKFYIDGDFGFGLGYQSPDAEKPIWLCVTSVSIGKNLPAYYQNTLMYSKNQYRTETYKLIKKIAQEMEDKCPDYTSPIILQLQGGNRRDTYKKWESYKEALGILAQIRWEHALIEFWTAWADGAGFSQIHLLQGENIAWNTPDCSRLAQFRRRYDGTAKKTGFRKDHNGLYALHLFKTHFFAPGGGIRGPV